MATLLHGPRLGAPATSGFKLWARFDGAATCVLETCPYGTSDWLVQDTQAVDAALDNTVVLTATALQERTRYSYRLLADGVEVATNSTWTMPSSGRFVLYHVSDGHGDNALTFNAVLADFEANYEPLGIPALIHQGGDLTEQEERSTVRAWLDDVILPELVEVRAACERLPLCYMWDDWDYAGNNSSRFCLRSFTAEADAYTASQLVWDILWRDHPAPASPSRSYIVEVANVALIVLDNRSQRTHRKGVFVNATTGLRGDEPLSNSISFMGAAHRQWLIDELRSRRGRGLVWMSTGSTFVDGAATIQLAAARDSIGLSFRAERNYLVQQGWCYASPWDSRRLVILSGDDHHSCVFNRQLGEPMRTDFALTPPYLGPRNGSHIGFGVWEFKVVSGAIAEVPGQAATFGDGEMAEMGGSLAAFARWDITSSRGGTQVTARITYVNSSTGATCVSLFGPSAGRTADFYYENGYLAYYDASATAQAQLYPPENLNGGVTFERGYVDAVSGVVARRRYMTRDHLWRLRAANEPGDIDELDRDEQRKLHVPRHEAPPRVIE